MSLQISSLVRNKSIRYGVRFIETIACKVLQEGENLITKRFRNIVKFFRTTNEILTHGVQLFSFLLTHCTTQNICLTKTKTCKSRSNLHYLFLVQDYAISIFENRFHQRMENFRSTMSVTTCDKVFRHTSSQRSGTVESNKRN